MQTGNAQMIVRPARISRRFFATSRSEMEVIMEELYIDRRSLVVPVKGELDQHLANILRARIDPVLEREGVRDIIYDFADTNFMDSSGIGMIMGRHRQVAYLGGRTGVCNVCQPLERVIRMAGLYRIVQKFDSRDEAVEAFIKTRTTIF